MGTTSFWTLPPPLVVLDVICHSLFSFCCVLSSKYHIGLKTETRKLCRFVFKVFQSPQPGLCRGRCEESSQL